MEQELPLLVVATRNAHKTGEIRAMLAGKWEVKDLSDYPQAPPVDETGVTFTENATLKALSASRCIPGVLLADDSGLEIDYLDGAPGIYSARFAGEDTSYDIKNRILLDKLEGVPDEERTARFVCAISAVFPDGTSETVRGTIEGRIAYEIQGENGFGYDPIFYVPEYGCTTAEMPPEQKNELSHRGNALRAIRKIMEDKIRERENA
mgnify:CR=1 FL=1